MANENDNVDIEVPEEENLGELDDTTDWKLKAEELQKKHREAGIRNREKTKALREEINSLKNPPVKKEEIKSDEFGLLEKTYLKAAGISDNDEIELVKSELKTAGFNKDRIDELISNPYFSAKLEKIRQDKANSNAVDVKNNASGQFSTKNTPEYWIAKGEMPPRTLENRKLWLDIIKMKEEKETSGSKFYND